MQATQSRTASGVEGSKDLSGHFVALRHMSRALEFGSDEQSGPVVAHVAEGAGLAHDAGNLLGALNLYSELLAMPGVLHEEHREYASELRLLSERSWAMIERLVNHARNMPEDEASATVLLEVVERCHGLLGKIAGREVEIVWNAGGFQPVNMPTEAVERIVTNLVKNAAEATSGNEGILISVKGMMVDGVRRVVLTVSDAGCGMSAEMLKALRAGAISRAGDRGIGFTVVQELVAMSGGRLEVASEPGVGTSVSVEWAALTQTDRATADRMFGRCVTAECGTKTVLKAEAGWIAC
ncbi:MAG TPA: HAMP domain-containing sensor histidine kinase [Edaphobacter sp.]|nr:HAMP domain-containing sensor histidine kinase [Edaphobacter sp.]